MDYKALLKDIRSKLSNALETGDPLTVASAASYAVSAIDNIEEKPVTLQELCEFMMNKPVEEDSCDEPVYRYTSMNLKNELNKRIASRTHSNILFRLCYCSNIASMRDLVIYFRTYPIHHKNIIGIEGDDFKKLENIYKAGMEDSNGLNLDDYISSTCKLLGFNSGLATRTSNSLSKLDIVSLDQLKYWVNTNGGLISLKGIGPQGREILTRIIYGDCDV